MDANRFVDSGETVYAFLNETLVVCPGCSGCALSQQVAPTHSPGLFSSRRLTCLHCGRTQDWAERHITRGWHRARDDYFDLPLWLQTPCCGEILWAYNERHLTFLESFVSSGLRQRKRHLETGWSNQSLASRLPRWIKSAKNREEVLKAASLLRAKLPESSG